MKKVININVLLLFFLLISTEILIAQESFYARVVKVSDGDTFTVLEKSGRKTKIRLYGVDAPELKQEYGMEAKKFTETILLNKNVKVEIKDKDIYGRVVADIYLGNLHFNKEIVRTGNSWYFRRYLKNSSEMEKAEKEARDGRAGLWKKGQPTAPWIFRKNNKN